MPSKLDYQNFITELTPRVLEAKIQWLKYLNNFETECYCQAADQALNHRVIYEELLLGLEFAYKQLEMEASHD